MANFVLSRGAVPICSWDLGTGSAEAPDSLPHDQIVVGELDGCAFELSPFDRGLDYQIRVGDVPISDLLSSPSDADGLIIQDRRIWREYPYFESARGITTLQVRSRVANGTGDWAPILSAEVYVYPTKLGEDSYQSMTRDLARLSHSLLVDLYGKSTSTYDVRFSRDVRVLHSREEELESIAAVVDGLGELMREIGRRPASRTETEAVSTQYWGTERLTGNALATLSRRGISIGQAVRPVSIRQRKPQETFDLPEHRALLGFLQLLDHRVSLCARAAIGHIQGILDERHLRDIRMGDGPTIFESIDEPKIGRLRDALQRADVTARLVRGLQELPFLRGLRPDLSSIGRNSFLMNGAYRQCLSLMHRFLLGNAIHFEGDAYAAVTKLTSRLFEQWCYLQIVDGFRACGLDLQDWDNSLKRQTGDRFTVDFDRGLAFEGTLGARLRLRIRYEPWILAAPKAEVVEDTLCRGGADAVSWCPDIVIECLTESGGLWEPAYAIVLDCKYTTRISDHHWNDTRKYTQIRATGTKAQVVKQLWLISVQDAGVLSCIDPAVQFKGDGPTCPLEECQYYLMGARPLLAGETGHTDQTFHRFAEATVRYLRAGLS